jgi:hypothetical protein
VLPKYLRCFRPRPWIIVTSHACASFYQFNCS